MCKVSNFCLLLLLGLVVTHVNASNLPKQPAKVLAKKGAWLNTNTRAPIAERQGNLIRKKGDQCQINIASVQQTSRGNQSSRQSNVDLRVSGDLTVICLK